MTTHLQMLDWSQQYMSIAGDGFKAEMIFLAVLTGNDNHAAVQNLTFQTQEWQYFASIVMPSNYSSTWVYIPEDYSLFYDQLQAAAVGLFNPTGEVYDHTLTVDLVHDDINLIVHRVLWSSDFGHYKIITYDPAVVDVLNAHINTTDDDLFAKVSFALAILGQAINITRLDQIINDTVLAPETYHAVVASMLTKIINANLNP